MKSWKKAEGALVEPQLRYEEGQGAVYRENWEASGRTGGNEASAARRAVT